MTTVKHFTHKNLLAFDNFQYKPNPNIPRKLETCFALFPEWSYALELEKPENKGAGEARPLIFGISLRTA
jgi:hypothetical protein